MCIIKLSPCIEGMPEDKLYKAMHELRDLSDSLCETSFIFLCKGEIVAIKNGNNEYLLTRSEKL